MSKTIVMIHGMFATGAVWQGYEDYFSAQGHLCLKPTLRFHDMDPLEEPDPRLGTTGISDYVNDLEQVINALYEPPTLMGHSMGALLALILAAKGHGSSLVMLNPAPPAGIWTVFNRDIWRAFLRYRFRWNYRRRPFRIGLKAASRGIFNLLSQDEARESYAKLVYESGQAIHEIGEWFLDRGKATRVDASKVSCPALIVGSGQDRITPAVITRKIANNCRAVAEYKEFEEHAHWILNEPGWEEVARYVHAWIEGSREPPP